MSDSRTANWTVTTTGGDDRRPAGLPDVRFGAAQEMTAQPAAPQDVVERLRKRHAAWLLTCGVTNEGSNFSMAADEIERLENLVADQRAQIALKNADRERLRASNKALVEALLPLARRAETPGADKMWDNDRVTMFMKDARNARAALAAAQEKT